MSKNFCRSCMEEADIENLCCQTCSETHDEFFTDRIAEKDLQIAELQKKLDLINTPEIENFMAGVPKEAQHQRLRWGSDHDSGKTAADWFWLIGYLAGKALYSHIAGDTKKALHHTITVAAACENWHAAILGQGNMRPGIELPKGEEDGRTED